MDLVRGTYDAVLCILRDPFEAASLSRSYATHFTTVTGGVMVGKLEVE